MTRDEFRTWLAAHSSAFMSFRATLQKHPERHDNPHIVTQATILRQWFDALADVELEDAMRVTKQWAKGEPAPPEWFDDHRPALRKLAKSYQLEREARENLLRMPTVSDDDMPRFRCNECHDSGRVSVFSWRCMRSARDDARWALWKRYTCAVECSCDKGTFLANAIAKRENRKVQQLAPWMVKAVRHFKSDEELRLVMLDALNAKEASEAKAVEWGSNYDRAIKF